MFKDNYSVKTNLKRLFIQRYERYLPTAFDESMTILEKMNKLIQSHNAIIDVVNSHVEFTSDQIERSFDIIDENLAKQLKQFRDELEEQKTLYEELRDQMYGDLLPDTVKQKLEEWLLNGTIKELIEDSVFPEWVERLQIVENGIVDLRNDVNNDLAENKTYVDNEVAENKTYVDNEVAENKTYVDNEVAESKQFVNDKIAERNTIMSDIVTDGVTDNYELVQSYIDNAEGILEAPKNSEFYISQPLDLSDSQVQIIDFRDSQVNAPNGGIINERGYTDRVTVKNVRFLGGSTVVHDTKSIGVEIGRDTIWGASIILENVRIDQYNIGFKGNALFNTELKNVFIGYCFLGMHIHSDLQESNIANLNTFDKVTVLFSEIGLYMSRNLNNRYISCTLESLDYGIVVGSNQSEVKFLSTYFEKVTHSNVTCGEIDFENKTIVKAETDNELKQVEFTGTRFSPDITEQYFIDPKFDFTSRYFDYGEDLNEKTFNSNNIIPKNIIQNETPVFKLFSNDTHGLDAETYYEHLPTPFGTMLVNNIKGTNLRSSARLEFNIEPDEFDVDDVFMVKGLVNVGTVKQLKHYITPLLIGAGGEGYNAIHETSKQIRTRRWSDFSKIMKITRKENFNGTLRVLFHINMNSNGEQVTDEYLDVSVSNFMFINLTKLFGKGNEPTEGMEEEISKYMKYSPAYLPERGRFVGDHYFGEDISKPVFWNGNNWTDSNGEIIQ